MHRYFFDTYDGDQLQPDEHGLECGTRAELRIHAIASLPDLARERLPDGDHHVFAVRVRDESGEAIFEASLTLEAQWLDGQQPHTGTHREAI